MIEPTADKDFPFIGWVPTANGRLSFRHVGDTSHPHVCTYANLYGADHARLIAAVQNRNLSDLLFAVISERYQRVSGRFWFTLACRSKDEDEKGFDALEGAICIFVPDNWTEPSVKLISQISTMNDRRLRKEGEQEAHRAYEAFETAAVESSDICVAFNLSRNGIVKVGLPKFKSEELRASSEEDASERNVNFSKWIADQAYFFLRDLCHFHQHHAPSTDTILTLQNIQSKHRNWRDCILYSLHHYVIRARRSNRVEDLHRATGVLGYIKAFQAICGLVAREGEPELKVMENDAIGQSISAKASELSAISLSDAQSTSANLVNRGAFIAIFAVFFTALNGIFQALFSSEMQRIHPNFIYIYNNPSATIVITAATLCAGLIYFSEAAARHRRRRRLNNIFWWRDILAAVSNPQFVGIILIFSSIILTVFIIYMSVRSP